ncbi:MAG: hypothetical protein HYX94_12905 [Chloroflexi bacterium]|nr:hypothetical protein [Chloroflexota bacterium]
MKINLAKFAIICLVLFTALMLGSSVSFTQGPAPTIQLLDDGSSSSSGERILLGDEDVIRTSPERDSAVAVDSDVMIEYVLPVTPTNLLISGTGDVWFSSFWGRFYMRIGRQSDSAIGRLEIATGNLSTYSLAGRGNVWGLKEDYAGNIWYSSVNTNTIGRLNPSTNIVTEWPISGNHHFGLDIDPTTGDIWFLTRSQAPGIYRLSPASNSVTAWATYPYTDVYDLDIDPDGNIWFTVQPTGDQGVGRLDRNTGQITVWTMPVADGRPFRLIADTNAEVWFTEFASTANSVTKLAPAANLLSQFGAPMSSISPSALLKEGNAVWFAEQGANGVGRLYPSLGSPTTTVLSPAVFSAPQTTYSVTPITSAVTREVTSTLTITGSVTRQRIGGVDQFSWPSGSIGSSGIAYDSGRGSIWLAEISPPSIGRLRTTATLGRKVFLPLAMRSYVGGW